MRVPVVKKQIGRAATAIACVLVGGTAYAVGLEGVLPVGTAGQWHIPEATVMVAQGIGLFMLARAVRRQPKSERTAPNAPVLGAIPLDSRVS
jgi:hypothetical protein